MTKKNEIIVPEIIQNVLSKCDDLIIQAMEREHDRFQRLIKSYEEWFLKFEPNHKFIYGPITHFLQHISGKYRVGGTVEYYCLIYSHPNRNESIYNKESFEKWFNSYKVEYKENQIWKLTQSMMKHLSNEDKLSSDVRISKTPKGFCVEFLFDRNGNTHSYITDAIDAGGYNIQRYHYRYITKIK